MCCQDKILQNLRTFLHFFYFTKLNVQRKKLSFHLRKLGTSHSRTTEEKSATLRISKEKEFYSAGIQSEAHVLWTPAVF